ncbi:MAG: prepilin-type N-terminal cleavage/methylation domain-containing protein [Proteobacteria bacterium]|nr:prepilin-type N-terminal cleavage/methylation domain-containing protein [Pseudomonadota bacterium]
MINNTVINNRGFTLIEIITSIVVVSIISVVAGMGISELAKAYVMSKKNAQTAQQGQISIARLKKEFSSISSITCGSDKKITYKIDRDSSGTEDTTTIYWTSGNSTLYLKTNSDCTDCSVSCTGGDILANNVSTFNLTYCTDADDTNCSPTFPNSPDYTSATVMLMKFTLVLKGFEDAAIPIANPDIVILGRETGQ